MSSSTRTLSLSAQLSSLRQPSRESRAFLVTAQRRHLGQSQSQQQQRRTQSTVPWRGNPANLLETFPNPRAKFRPSQATRQNRFNEHGLRPIKQNSHQYAGVRHCPDPVAAIENGQIKILDPTGQRTTLFSRSNPARVTPGDVLLVRLKNGEPFSGVCLSIRQGHSKVDWAILLRNQLTRISTEMWFKVYSPNIEGIEVVQRAARRARRVRLYYMRKPKHDIGSVDGIVRQYMRRQQGTTATPAKATTKKGKGKKKAAKAERS